ncbi:MAG: patatin-like phospholipase family protein [Candidatus Obscuribacter sp.]|nr:patatin-like phospholipase family protein [Candidatus Obscuribacter sp.]
MTLKSSGIELVLGAGGVKGFGHVGVLDAIHELNIPIQSVTGVSVGSLVAVLYANGYTPDEIFAELVHGSHGTQQSQPHLRASRPRPLQPDGRRPIDLSVSMQEMVDRLKPGANDQLKIVACDILRHEPVVFEGSDYGTSASPRRSPLARCPLCCAPSGIRTAWFPRLLVDGAVYHHNPIDLCANGAIEHLPHGHRDAEGIQVALRRLLHLREQYAPIAAIADMCGPAQAHRAEID